MSITDTVALLSVVEQVNVFAKKHGLVRPPESVDRDKVGFGSVLNVLKGDGFADLVGYFQNHRPKSDLASISDEYKVQDIIYCLLKPIVTDLHYEDPIGKPVGGVTSTRVDFVSDSLSTLIEVKYIDSRSRAKAAEKEISEDIVKYGRSRKFDSLVFFVYLANYSLPNKSEFEKGFTGQKNIDGNSFKTTCIVK